jgi:acetoin utilization protein AcuC
VVVRLRETSGTEGRLARFCRRSGLWGRGFPGGCGLAAGTVVAMSASTLVVWGEELTGYDLGAGHPLRPVRLELTIDLARRLGVLDRQGVTVEEPITADDATLGLVHDQDYIAVVKTAPTDLPARLAARYGLGTSDNPIFPAMHAASALSTGATVQAARAVWSGKHEHAINIAGGLHHAMADRASGFCVYDDPAVAIAWLLAQGAQRVAYVDIDVHHGDGVQAAFYDDPRVLTLSVHESGRTLFPGTGFAEELGSSDGRGTSVNLALPSGVGDAEYIAAFDAIVPPVLRAYRPEILVTQLGCDTHALDPLAHLELTLAGQRYAYAALHRLAHELCGGRWVATGGGGYALFDVVPRAWTHALAEMTGEPVGGETPDAWRELVRERSGRDGPGSLDDPERVGTGRGLSESIDDTREAVFPLLGAT